MTKEERDLLYLNNYKRKSFQWELWRQCNNHCDFCYLGKQNLEASPTDKVHLIDRLIDAITHLDFTVYNNISLIGGDFFQGEIEDPEVNKKFFELIDLILNLYLDHKIGSFWLLSTMILGDQHDLYKVIDMFERAGAYPDPEYGSSGLWICTSWDSKGRFHNKNSEKNWEYHMKNIHEKYPWVKFNTTMILQQDLLEKYLNDEINFTKFQEKFNTSLFLKQCLFSEKEGSSSEWDKILNKVKTGCDIEEIKEDVREVMSAENMLKKFKEFSHTFNRTFFPNRDTYIKFLKKLFTKEPQFLNCLINISLRADELHTNFNSTFNEGTIERDKNSMSDSDSATYEIDISSLPSLLEHNQNLYKVLEFMSSPEIANKDKRPCGHKISTSLYSDSDRCLLCDTESMKQIFSEV